MLNWILSLIIYYLIIKFNCSNLIIWSLFLLRRRCAVVAFHLAAVISSAHRSVIPLVHGIHPVSSVAHITAHVTSVVLPVVTVVCLRTLVVPLAPALWWLSVISISSVTRVAVVAEVAGVTALRPHVRPHVAHIPGVPLIPGGLVPPHLWVSLPRRFTLVLIASHLRSAVVHAVVIWPSVVVFVEIAFPLERIATGQLHFEFTPL